MNPTICKPGPIIQEFTGGADLFERFMPIGPVGDDQEACILTVAFVCTNGTDYTTRTRNVEVSLVSGRNAVNVANPYAFANALDKVILLAETVPIRTITFQPMECIVPRINPHERMGVFVRVAPGTGDWHLFVQWGRYRRDR